MHYEEELDADAPEREDPPKGYSEEGGDVARGWGDGPCYPVGLYGDGHLLGLEAEVRAGERKGYGDASPKGEDAYDCQEGYGGRGTMGKQEEVEAQEKTDQKAGKEEGSAKGVALPVLSTEELVQARCGARGAGRKKRKKKKRELEEKKKKRELEEKKKRGLGTSS